MSTKTTDAAKPKADETKAKAEVDAKAKKAEVDAAEAKTAADIKTAPDAPPTDEQPRTMEGEQNESLDVNEVLEKAAMDDPTLQNRDAGAKVVITDEGKAEARDRHIPPPNALNAVEVEALNVEIANRTADITKALKPNAPG